MSGDISSKPKSRNDSTRILDDLVEFWKPARLRLSARVEELLESSKHGERKPASESGNGVIRSRDLTSSKHHRFDMDFNFDLGDKIFEWFYERK